MTIIWGKTLTSPFLDNVWAWGWIICICSLGKMGTSYSKAFILGQLCCFGVFICNIHDQWCAIPAEVNSNSIPIPVRAFQFSSNSIQFLPMILDLNSISIPIPKTLKNAKIRFQFQFKNWNCTSLYMTETITSFYDIKQSWAYHFISYHNQAQRFS